MTKLDEFANVDMTIEEEIAAAKKKAKKKLCKKAKKKATYTTGCQQPLKTDLNGDCKTGLHDVAVLYADWLKDESP